MTGTYWDDAWHTDRGQDSFWVAPHVVLYGGVTVMALAVGAWWWRVGSRVGRRAAWSSDKALRGALTGVVVMFASAPVDDLWHTLYGRDAVLWSPPHLLATMATLAVGVGLLEGLARLDTILAPWLKVGAGVLVLGGLLVPVMEYEADVPQFSTTLYLPVLSAAVVIAAALVTSLKPCTASGSCWFPTG